MWLLGRVLEGLGAKPVGDDAATGGELGEGVRACVKGCGVRAGVGKGMVSVCGPESPGSSVWEGDGRGGLRVGLMA